MAEVYSREELASAILARKTAGNIIYYPEKDMYEVDERAFRKGWLKKRKLTGVTAREYQQSILTGLPKEAVEYFFECRSWVEPLDEMNRGQLTATGDEAVRTWVGHFAHILNQLAQGEEVGKELGVVGDAINLLIKWVDTWWQEEKRTDPLGGVIESLRKLRDKADCAYSGDDGYPDVSIMREEFRVRLIWRGSATEGRFFSVDWDVMSHSIKAEWDTATGKESTFLSLPSAARKFASANSKTALYRIKRIV
ncbi:MAG: hypothetical protein WCJ25_02620 [Candidatus Moraniibacteriota bacterium]